MLFASINGFKYEINYTFSLSILSGFAFILLRKRELVSLLEKCSCCHVAVCVLGIFWSFSLVFCFLNYWYNFDRGYYGKKTVWNKSGLGDV